MPTVVVYTRTTCAPCRTLKHWLSAKNVPFTELNVDSNPRLMDEVIAKSGYQVVPLIQVGDTFVSGLNLPLLSRLLML
jgi:glutaredoxin 3